MARVFLTTLNAKFVHSSLALRYLRAYVADAHEVIMEEFTIHDPMLHILGQIFKSKPDVVGLSCYIWNIEEIRQLVPLIKKVLPGTIIVLGGPEVSYETNAFLEENLAVDVVVVGEGEKPLRELLAVVGDRSEWCHVRGVYYRDEQCVIRRTGIQEKIPLDEIPTPYPDDRMDELHQRIVYFEASRGCPFHCQFCLSSIEDGVRYFSLQRVIDELNHLIRAGVRQIKFVDRTFNLRKDYALKIFEHLIQTPGDTTFHFEITGDILRSDVVQWLCDHAPAGLFRFEIGVQSTNDVTNDLVQRRQDFTRLSTTVRNIKASGRILQHLDLIAGLPEEDYQTFRKTFDDVFALRPDELQLGFLKLLKGTGLRKMAEQFGYVYMETAPYELLSNKSLSFSDVLQLKYMEDILEKYYNSGRFPLTIDYLMKNSYTSAFDFFQSFGIMWNENEWSRIGHQPLDLIDRLRQFLLREGRLDVNVETLLHADYLLREKMRPRTLWWDTQCPHGLQLQLLRTLFDQGHIGGHATDDRLLVRQGNVEKRIVFDRATVGAIQTIFPEKDMADAHGYYFAYVYPSDVGKASVYLLFDQTMETHNVTMLQAVQP